MEQGLIEFGESRKVGEVQIFDNPQFGQIRTAGTAENPLFCAVDVARALGYANPSKAVIDHCKGVTVLETPTNGGVQNMKYIAEPEVYRLIFKSNAPNAEKFNSWLAEDVLPSIRKTGSYSIQNLSRKELALMVIQAEEENERLSLENKQQAEKIKTDAPKVSYFEAFMQAAHGSKSVGIREVVKQAHIKSEKKFIQWMQDRRILFRQKKDNRLQPYREYTACFDSVDVHDKEHDWSGKQLLMNPYGKLKIVKRYHKECPGEFAETRDMFNR